MSEIILVRHGQAGTNATDAASYDMLSEVGRQQGAWLGDWLRATNPHFDRVFTGTLSRQRATAEAMGYGPAAVEDAGWDEIDYWGLGAALERDEGVPFPQSREAFAAHLPVLYTAWAEGRIGNPGESYATYLDRAEAALMRAAAGGGRVLAVTSAGLLGGVFARLLDLGIAAQSRMILQIQNTSVHRIEVIHGQPILSEYGTTPHLAAGDRAAFRTFI